MFRRKQADGPTTWQQVHETNRERSLDIAMEELALRQREHAYEVRERALQLALVGQEASTAADAVDRARSFEAFLNGAS